MTRGKFLAALAVVLAGSVACGGQEDTAGTPDAASRSFTITNDDDSGHSHELTVLCSDLVAGVAVTYVATGPHSHTVMLSQEEVMMVADRQTVTISFTDGHSHTFVVVQPDGAC